MFKVVSNPQFTHNVDVLIPVDGGHDKQSFKATFRVLDAGQKDEDRHDLNTTVGSTAFLKEVVVSLDDLTDEQDQKLEYSDRLRDQLLNVPYIRTALARCYFAAITKATLGN